MIHLYWHAEPDDQVKAAIDSWMRVGEDVTVWSSADFPALFEQVAATSDGVKPIDLVRHRANVARWHILAERGGIWVDADVIALRPLTGLPTTEPWCASLNGIYTPFVCGGPAGAEVWARARTAALDHPHGTSPDTSGGRLLGRVARKGEIQRISANYFSAADASGHPLPEPVGGRYTLHAWSTSRHRLADVRRRVNHPSERHRHV